MLRRALNGFVAASVLAAAPAVRAQPSDPAPTEPLPPSTDPLAAPPAPTPVDPAPAASPPPASPPPQNVDDDLGRPPPPEPMSEGRAIVVAWNTGFQWGLAPGVVFAGGKTSFFLGVRLGYGFDTGSVILVPGVRLAGYFTDPNVYLGMPVMKLVVPIDRFAPFVEAGAGVGHVSSASFTPAETGAALLAGGGFMVHFTARFGLGVEANYTTITGTEFRGFGVGPILALAF